MPEGFQPAKRIVDVLRDIEHQQLVLPAIQREFVWSEAKICSLFDSLLRGYPIGGFLFWRVSDATVGANAFYGFIRDYDQRPPKNFCPRLDAITPSDNRFAILDGQQRLTSLNIGLRGSHAVKLPNKWWDNPDAFPKRYLYLDLPTRSRDRDRAGVTKPIVRTATAGQPGWADSERLSAGAIDRNWCACKSRARLRDYHGLPSQAGGHRDCLPPSLLEARSPVTIGCVRVRSVDFGAVGSDAQDQPISLGAIAP